MEPERSDAVGLAMAGWRVCSKPSAHKNDTVASYTPNCTMMEEPCRKHCFDAAVLPDA